MVRMSLLLASFCVAVGVLLIATAGQSQAWRWMGFGIVALALVALGLVLTPRTARKPNQDPELTQALPASKRWWIAPIGLLATGWLGSDISRFDNRTERWSCWALVVLIWIAVGVYVNRKYRDREKQQRRIRGLSTPGGEDGFEDDETGRH